MLLEQELSNALRAKDFRKAAVLPRHIPTRVGYVETAIASGMMSENIFMRVN